MGYTFRGVLCDYSDVRTTVNIDDDVVAAARALAERTGSSLGCALSELARRGSRSASAVGDDGDGTTFNVAPDAEPITNEDVHRSLSEWP